MFNLSQIRPATAYRVPAPSFKLPTYSPSEFTPAQQEAIETAFQVVMDNGIGRLRGAAGTGKTYALRGHILKVLHETNIKVTLCAPTHQAVGVVVEKLNFTHIRLNVSTLASALSMREYIDDEGNVSFIPQDKKYPNLKGVGHLIVDESSMIGDIEFRSILEAMSLHDFSILFVGDFCQIQPVRNKGASFALDVERFEREYGREFPIDTVTLTDIIRQGSGSPIIQLASDLREAIEAKEPYFYLENRNYEESIITDTPDGKYKQGILVIDDVDDLMDFMSAAYNNESAHIRSTFIRTVAYKNETVRELNELIRYMRYGDDAEDRMLIEGEHIVLRAPYLQNKIVICNNNEEVRIEEIENSEVEFTIAETLYTIPTFKVTLFRVYTAAQTKFIAHIPTQDGKELLDEIMGEYAEQINSLPPAARKDYWRHFFSIKENFLTWRYCHAQTVHTSQGSTFNICIVLWDEVASVKKHTERCNLLYTAITRPSDLLVIFRGHI
jgi:exodeoxyribonuclease V